MEPQVEAEGSNYSILQSSSSSSDHEEKNSNNWTDEKHLHFLRLMEDSFVKSMFQINNHNNGYWPCHHQRRRRSNILRLDRFVPDSSESTLDVKKDIVKRRRNISSSSDETVSSSDKLDAGTSSTGRQRRRLMTADRCSIISQDQVVPAVGVSKG